MNESLTYQVLQAALHSGVTEFVICPGSRNHSFLQALKGEADAILYYWFEERSAAFFALGRSKESQRPVAVITTSGTAVAELLPATMEAYYSGIPLLLITADRPQRFRGKGAPQGADQPRIFGLFAPFVLDVLPGATFSLSAWSQQNPAHINVCLEEPQSQPQWQGSELHWKQIASSPKEVFSSYESAPVDNFFSRVNYPIVLVSTLKQQAREAVVEFLIKLNVPVILEGISGIREDPRLQHLAISQTEKVLLLATQAGYPIDGVLRIGGVPTQRLWRDLEYLESKIEVCSISDVPFSGLSWDGAFIYSSIDQFFRHYSLKHTFNSGVAAQWLEEQHFFREKLLAFFEQESAAEPALIHQLSRQIPHNSLIYLGNSLPIREWDLAATQDNRQFSLFANRGMNGIDGQISTFLGTCREGMSNWAILGDLTALYDLAGPWILSQLEGVHVNIVIINNSGGKIFARLFPSDSEMQNSHLLSFEPFAKMWGLSYVKWEGRISTKLLERGRSHLIEVIPDNTATQRFWSLMAKDFQTLNR